MSGMSAYFIRRLLMVPITFLVITFLVYAILRIVPGGPIEQAEAQMLLHSSESGGGSSGASSGQGQLQMSTEGLRHLAVYYALDRSVPVGYLQWLGVWPRERDHWIPPVPPDKHKKVLAELQKDRQALQSAEKNLAQRLKSRGLIAYRGGLYRPASPDDLGPTHRKRVADLLVRTFGARFALEDYLGELGFAWKPDRSADPVEEQQSQSFDAEKEVAIGDPFKTGQLLRRVPPPKNEAWAAKATQALSQIAAAQRALKKDESAAGYALTGANHLVQMSLLPIQKLNAVRAVANERLAAFLAPRHLYAYQGNIYRPIPKKTLDSPKLASFFHQAHDLVSAGYTSRPDLLAFLAKRGFTWSNDVYYEAVPHSEEAKSPEYFATARALSDARDLAQQKLEQVQATKSIKIDPDGRMYRVHHRLAGILELQFGDSYESNQPVVQVMLHHIGISLPYVLTGYLLAWIVCIPLGVIKAIKHRSLFDNLSSIAVFIGYAIPGFVVALILLVVVAANVSWIPLGGYLPPNADQLGWLQLLWARCRYMIIPVIAYTAGSFAMMTILMKNSLLENLGQDYVRTAFAKGLSEKRVIFVHALRNSLIPITAGIGSAFAILFSGSFLIEVTCNIPGMGMLGYTSILHRDYAIVMGIMVFGVLIQLFGNILSDLIWAAIDPRIRFGR